jgi:hypothetical protein
LFPSIVVLDGLICRALAYKMGVSAPLGRLVDVDAYAAFSRHDGVDIVAPF